MEPAVTLRAVTDADVDVFFEHQRDPVAAEMAAFPARDRAAHDRHWAKIRTDENSVLRTIDFGDEVAGNIGSWVHDSMRLTGYWIGREHWGKGIASGALAQFVELVPDRPLYAYVAKDNVASVRVLEKCGFVAQTEHTGDDGVVELLMQLSA